MRFIHVKKQVKVSLKNTTSSKKTKNKKKKKRKFKNLYTLHVLIKVTEPVRILDSSCI